MYNPIDHFSALTDPRMNRTRNHLLEDIIFITIATLDPAEFEACFLEWVKNMAHLTQGEIVSIDGKTLWGSADRGRKSAIHLVSAWASTNKLVLGQIKTAEKSNEITAIPQLLAVLELAGCIVTIDEVSNGDCSTNCDRWSRLCNCRHEQSRTVARGGGRYAAFLPAGVGLERSR